ncbi:hypothetical protein KC315_g7751 [Hortaea werneckii]|nr:hypothetical protein KC315_g7751 [Hortaea werneckii]
MASIQVPSKNALRGRHSAKALDATKSPMPEMEYIHSLRGFAAWVEVGGDPFSDALIENNLFMVGVVETTGLSHTYKRHVYARWATHDIANKDNQTIVNRDIDFFVGPTIEPEEVTIGYTIWFELPLNNSPYTDFRGVAGTHLWLQVHDLGLVHFHPTYQGDGDDLRSVWRNIYAQMNGETAPTHLMNANAYRVWREMEVKDEDQDDEEPAWFPRVKKEVDGS